MEGLEPPRLAALEPKSSASTNFATSAVQKAQIARIAIDLKGQITIPMKNLWEHVDSTRRLAYRAPFTDPTLA